MHACVLAWMDAHAWVHAWVHTRGVCTYGCGVGAHMHVCECACVRAYVYWCVHMHV